MTEARFEDAYPLSPLQHGLLFHSLFTPGAGVYVTQVSCVLEAVDVPAFEQAWRRVVERHTILRTAFVWKKTEQPLQVVGRKVVLPFAYQDWRELDARERAARLQEFLAVDREKGFEPSRAPLMRLTLFRLGEDSYQLVWSHHHLLLDGWSVPILLGEVAAFYEAFRKGREVEMESSRPYGDYIDWLEQQDLAAAQAFWRGTLQGFEHPTPLPGDRATGGGALALSDPSGEREVHLPELPALRLLARRARVTLNTLVQGAWALLLSRYGAGSDVLFGATVSGRPPDLEGAERMVGLFINTLPVRVTVARRQGVLSWLQRLQAQQAEMRQFEHSPLVRVQGWSEVPRGVPLFESLVVFENYLVDGADAQSLSQTGLRISGFRTAETTSYPLSLLAAAGERMTLRMLYDRDRFEDMAVERALSQLRVLLEGMASDPERSLDALPMLTAAERHQLLVEWCSGGAWSSERGLHRIFESAVERAPESTALIHEGRSVSYGELNRRANRLAHHLRRLGVGVETPVALLLERSVGLVVAILGVLKAGGAYVPLDSTYPAERLQLLLSDTAAPVLVTEGTLADGLEVEHVVRLDTDLSSQSASNLEGGAGTENACYVIYTSGSTGRPKGVVITHANVERLFQSSADRFGFGPSDVWTLFHSYAFDFSVWEIWGALLYGGRLVIVPYLVSRDPEAFFELLLKERVTVLNQTPSAFRQLVQAQARWPAGTQTDLRFVIFGGEALDPGTLKPWLERYGDSRPALVNMYGITETTVHVTYRPVRLEDLHKAAGSRIGLPLQDLQAYLLDATGEPVPVGAPGELYVGGAGLARGYLGRPDLTASRFLPDRFSGRPGARLYRSGDLGRWRPDGDLEYLGRIDHQVKVHGFRIELGEIEAALREHPAVQDVVALAREDAGGEKRLLAYVVAPQSAGAGGELRSHLKRRLPEHMVPAAFVFLGALPLTPNGKLDRRALPDPERSRTESSREWLAPRTQVEETLAAIWREVLELDRVGVLDNFFELGGDSILCLQIVARAHQKGLTLTPKQLFERPTVAGLAEVADQAPAVESEQGPVTGAVPLTPVQHWFFEQDLPNPHHFNQAVLLTVAGPLNAVLLKQAVDGLAIQHDALRMRFHRDDAGWHQVNGGPRDDGSPFHRIDLSPLGGEAWREAVESAATAVQAGLDLARGPLIRIVCFDAAGGQEARLLIVIHHLIVDGVSWRVLLEDLQTGYARLERGEELKYPLKSTSFRAWAHRLQEYAASPRALAELEHWRRGARAGAARLPVDFPGTGGLQTSARAVFVALSAEETRGLLQDVPRAYRTQINDALLTALALALAEWMGGGRLLIDLEGHGREELFDGVDLSRTVGWFTTIFPVLLELDESRRQPEEALKSIKEQLRGVPNRGIGHGLLRYLSPDAEVRDSLCSLPAAEISFNYLGQVDQALPAASIFRPAMERTGPAVDPRGRRPYLLQVSGQVVNKRLQLALTYGEDVHRAETARGLLDRMADALRRLVVHCQSAAAGGYTPSDFPGAGLNQEELDRVIAGLGPGRPGRGIESIDPLSPMQQGMLFHSLMEPSSGVFVQQSSFRLEGALDRESLRRAWQRVVDRHAALRTAFVWEELVVPLQAALEGVELPWEELDWQGLPAREQGGRLARFLEQDARRGFDLSRAPLIRVTFLTLSPAAHQMVFTYHHLVLDGWSTSLLQREVLTCYEAFRKGRNPDLPVSRPYRELIAWIQAQDLGRAEEFWRGLLGSFGEPTPLVVDRRPEAPPAGQGTFGEEAFLLSEVLSRDLQVYAKRHQLTLNTLAQGAWALLLSRYSGKSDVVFGVTVSGRPAHLPGAESMVGLFINTLPIRVELMAERPLAPWLQDLQMRQVEIRQFEYSPLVQVQRWSGVAQGRPLFESILVFENYPVQEVAEAADEEALQIREALATERPHYPLAVLVVPGERTLLKIYFDRRRFEPLPVRRALRHFATLMESMTQPDRVLSSLRMLTAAECQQARLEWNDSRADYRESRPLHEIFAAWAEETPDAVAVAFEGEEVSYGELSRRSNRLARYLQRFGVGPDVAVGICAERSVEMVVGLLGILSAGGAYLPLDPEYPTERLAFMLEQSQVPVVLVQDRLIDRLPLLAIRVIRLDAEQGAIARESDAPLFRQVQDENLAYVIYTSGSTGRPKGVMIDHRGIRNRLRWIQQTRPLDPADRVIQKTPFSFDVSVWELFWPLTAGACLVVARPGGHRDSFYLSELIERQRITTAHFVPSMLQVFLDGPRAGDCRSLRRVFCSGEALSHELQQRFFERLDADLHNLYGPTEASVEVTSWQCSPTSGLSVVPIGRPIANLQIRLLDPELRPTPIGVAGELCIGGVGLARGYLARPDLTAERFLPDPLAESAGERLYRTGDLARYLPDGAVEYLGRLDHQVKVRGFRIELGEIEATLATHPGVRESVVTAAPFGAGDVRLAVYVVPSGSVSAGELRQHLQDKLPEYMVPSFFTFLEELPLTPSGKLDRRALPAPEVARADSERGFVAPRTPAEEILAEVWREVLGLERVGVLENFFELGGDSILCLQIVARSHQRGLRLTPKQLFERPTVAGLAEVVVEAPSVAGEQGLVTGAVPLTPVQHWFFEQELPEPHHFNQAMLFEVDDALDPPRLARVFDLLAAHHDALRLLFRRDGAGWHQINAGLGGEPAFLCVDLAAISTELLRGEIESAASRVQESLSLARGPLARMVLFASGPDRPDRLLLVAHHLVIDGVSWRVLLEDLQTAYSRLDRDQEPELPAKTTSFQAWARRLQEYAASPEAARDLGYWRDPVRRTVAALPVDGAGSGNAQATARTASVALDAEETRTLLQEVPKAYRTQINDVLLTALAVALRRWTGERRFLIDLEGHGREDLFEGLDLSRTVGWFTSIFPVLLELGEDGGPGEAIKAVKEQLRRVPARGVSYGVLRYLSPDAEARESLRGLPQPEVSFNYLGQIQAPAGLASPMRFGRESTGSSQSRHGARRHRLGVNAVVAGGRLVLSWAYDEDLHRRETIERLAGGCVEALRDLMRHCLDRPGTGATPSDFPLARVDQGVLDRLLVALGDIEDLYPLSPTQHGMLFHTLYSPASGMFVTQSSWSLSGALDVAALEQAWREILARHPVLRTGFVWEGLDEPLQVVHRTVEARVRSRDLRGLDPREQAESLGDYLRDDRQLGFELTRPPLLRLAVFQRQEESFEILLSHHHLLLDGWSMPLLLKELVGFYQAFARGESLHLGRPRPYRDYIAWLQRQEIGSTEGFWRELLSGFETATALGVDRTLGEGAGGSRERHIRLAPELTAGLQALARRYQLTLSTLFQGAWAVLLSRYSGQADVVFGSTVSGRPPDLAAAESMIGLFINTLPVRVKIDPADSLLSCLRRIQAQQVEVRQYEFTPLAAIQAWSEVPRGSALFESILVFENYPIETVAAEPGAEVMIREAQSREQANYPLAIEVLPGSRLTLQIQYDPSRFTDVIVQRMLDHFNALLVAITDNPETFLSELEIGSEEEETLTSAFNENLEVL
jgi:amino acid adenylation domain-containing protein/non-ribosomal peptide synthase protein (TIGR01720 family)